MSEKAACWQLWRRQKRDFRRAATASKRVAQRTRCAYALALSAIASEWLAGLAELLGGALPAFWWRPAQISNAGADAQNAMLSAICAGSQPRWRMCMLGRRCRRRAAAAAAR